MNSNDRPTPETDAEITSYFKKKHVPIVCYHELAKFTRRLERERDDLLDRLTALEHSTPVELAKIERERDEAREAAEKAKAFKRVMKEDNAKLRRELDELNKRLIEVCQYGVVCTIEREDLRKEVAAERALADRLAEFTENCLATSSFTRLRRLTKAAFNAWKEARK